MAKVTVAFDNHTNLNTMRDSLHKAANEVLKKALADSAGDDNRRVNIGMTYEITDRYGDPVKPMQQFVEVQGVVKKVGERSLVYALGSRKLHEKRIPLSVIKGGDTMAPGTQNIMVKRWFVNKEVLNSQIGVAL